MARAAATTFKGLLPLLDRKRVPEPYVVDGKNFLVNADGPISGFAKKNVTDESIANPENVQSFRVEAGTVVLTFAAGVVLEYSNEANDFIPVFTFTEPTEAFPWSHATVGGINYFAKKGVGLLEYNEITGQWSTITGADVPNDIQVCTQSGGRLVVAATGISAWTSIDDGTDFAPSTTTGAGFQSLSLIAAPGADDILGLVEVVDGYLTITKNGVMRSELIQAINPFRHRRMTEQHDPIPVNPFCVVEFAEFQHVILSRQGFFTLTAGSMEPFQPIMGEYFHSTILPKFDLDNIPNIVRLAVNFERQWFIVSVSANEDPGNFTIAYVLYLPSDEWGTFNQLHTGFIDIDINTGTSTGFSFGIVDAAGTLSRFTDGAVDEIWPVLTDFLYDYHVNVEFPARREVGVNIMPTRIRLVTVDESQFSSSSVYDLAFEFEESIAPDDLDAVEIDSVLGSLNEMKTVMQMGSGIIQIITKPEAFNQQGLDAFINLGLWRFIKGENPDETSGVTNVIIGMLDSGAGIGDTFVDWLLDFSLDILFDWETDTTDDEDWNEGGTATTNYTAKIFGSSDGYRTLGADLDPANPMEEVLTLIQEEGRNKFFSCNSNAMFHLIRVDANEVNESFHLKTMEIRGILTGRV